MTPDTIKPFTLPPKIDSTPKWMNVKPWTMSPSIYSTPKSNIRPRPKPRPNRKYHILLSARKIDLY